MNLSRPFILRPVATSLLMLALLLSGIFAYRLLPVSALDPIQHDLELLYDKLDSAELSAGSLLARRLFS